jgi:hypothetical protein
MRGGLLFPSAVHLCVACPKRDMAWAPTHAAARSRTSRHHHRELPARVRGRGRRRPRGRASQLVAHPARGAEPRRGGGRPRQGQRGDRASLRQGRAGLSFSLVGPLSLHGRPPDRARLPVRLEPDRRRLLALRGRATQVPVPDTQRVQRALPATPMPAACAGTRPSPRIPARTPSRSGSSSTPPATRIPSTSISCGSRCSTVRSSTRTPLWPPGP